MFKISSHWILAKFFSPLLHSRSEIWTYLFPCWKSLGALFLKPNLASSDNILLSYRLKFTKNFALDNNVPFNINLHLFSFNLYFIYSVVAGLKTHAVQKGGDFVISGQKMFITNGMQADICLVLATTDPSLKAHRNKSLIVVPMDSPGIRKTKIDKLGFLSSDTAILFFDEVRVPLKNLVGELNEGFTYQMLQFQEERMCAVAKCIF